MLPIKFRSDRTSAPGFKGYCLVRVPDPWGLEIVALVGLLRFTKKLTGSDTHWGGSVTEMIV